MEWGPYIGGIRGFEKAHQSIIGQDDTPSRHNKRINIERPIGFHRLSQGLAPVRTDGRR